jgi:hypothetical protein
MKIPSSRQRRLNLIVADATWREKFAPTVGLWSLRKKCAHATQRRGGFSPPSFIIQAMGRGKPAPTMPGALFFQRP